jgi:hypothetical protein
MLTVGVPVFENIVRVPVCKADVSLSRFTVLGREKLALVLE